VGKGHAIATLEGRLVIGLWVKTPFLESVATYHRVGTEAARLYPEGIAFLTIADRPGSPPDAATRAVYGKMLKDFHAVSRASALVTMGGSALAHSVVRGVFTSIMLLVSSQTKLKIFPDVLEAATWLQKRCGERGVKLPDGRAVDDVVKDLQARMAAAP
jgi:hypothetical protein